MPTAISSTFRKRSFNVAPYEDKWIEWEAFHGEQLAGRVVCFEAAPKDCWIHDLWVDRDHRGSGLGSELLRRAVDTATSRGYLRVLGELRPYDESPTTRVEAFFRRHGFGVNHNWDGLGHAVIILALR